MANQLKNNVDVFALNGNLDGKLMATCNSELELLNDCVNQEMFLFKQIGNINNNNNKNTKNNTITLNVFHEKQQQQPVLHLVS